MIPRRLLLVAALASALVAGAAYYLDARRVSVVVAARSIESEATLVRDDLAVVALPPAAVPADALGDPGEASGRVVRTPLLSGQLVLRSAFEGAPGFRSGIRPPLGWRAVALPVSPATALGGAIVPGARVDVVAVPVSGRAPADRGIERLASGLLVLDVRSETGGPFAEPGTEKGAFANTRLGSLIVAVPPQEDVTFADRIVTSTFIVFRSP